MPAPDITLSVVVPCHNVARFLPTTLAGADRNAADDIEWIFVDEGSTDGTHALLSAYRPPSGSTRIITHPKARGIAAARNAGTAAAEGRYLTFLDADDWYAPGHLRRMIDAIERLGVDFVRTDHVQSEGRDRTPRFAPESRRERALLAIDGVTTTPGRACMVDYPFVWSGIYDRSLRDRGLLTVDETVHTAEDRLMTWRLHLHAERFGVVDGLGYFYRREVQGSLTKIGDERRLHFFDAYDLVGDEVLGEARYAPYRAKFVRSYLALILFHEASRAKMTRGVYARFRDRARRTIAAFPRDLVDAALTDMDSARGRAVRRLA